MTAALFLLLATLAPPQEAEGLARLRELAELGLAAEVAVEGRDAVSEGGALARSGEAVALVARALFETGDEEGALALLGVAEGRRAVDEPALLELERARLRIERDELEDAIRLLAAPGESPPRPRLADEPDAWLLLGRALSRSGRHERAEPVLARFVQGAPLHPEAPSAWHMLLDAALARGDVEAAEERRAEERRWRRWHELMRIRRLQARRAPEAPEPRLGIALLWLDAGDDERARAALRELVRVAPSSCEGWLHLGSVERRRGADSAAEEAFRRALECDPDEDRARHDLALLFAETGREEEARRELERLFAGEAGDDPRFARAHLALARILLGAGEDEAAEARYARYRALGGEEALRR